MSKRIYQRQVPVFIVSFLIAVFFIEYFGGENPIINGIVNEFLSWGSIIALISLSFGYFSLMLMHVQRIRARTRGSEGVSGKLLFKSIVVVASFSFFILLGLFEGKMQLGNMWTFWFTATVAMAGATWWQEWTHHFFCALPHVQNHKHRDRVSVLELVFGLPKGDGRCSRLYTSI